MARHDGCIGCSGVLVGATGARRLPSPAARCVQFAHYQQADQPDAARDRQRRLIDLAAGQVPGQATGATDFVLNADAGPYADNVIRPLRIVPRGFPVELAFGGVTAPDGKVKGREVVLYWREMKPSQQVRLPLSLVAAVPGTYTAPASRAYLYYTDEFKDWVTGPQVTVTPKD